MSSTGGVTDEQLHAMWRACTAIADEPDVPSACRRLADEITRILGSPAVVFRRDVSPWKPMGPSSLSERAPAPLDVDSFAVSPAPFPAPIAGQDDTRWTPVPIADEPPSQSILLLPGDWQSGPAASWMPRLSATASLALRLVSAREAARRGETLVGTAYAFARKSGQVSRSRPVYDFIVEAAARTGNARLVGLSVYQPRENAITVAATYGYPRAVVGDVRIAPGSGIIGGVFASRRPLLVRDTTRVPGLTPPSTRYRTPSFMALPIVAGRESIGVLTLADRTDGAPFTREDLTGARLITALASLTLMRAQLATRVDELAHTAAVDSLTSLFNRRYLETRLEAEVERGRRNGSPVGVVMLDVDGFKRINDTLGHQVGDTVLRRVAEIIRRSVRFSDVCTRYGGDEFAIVVPDSATSAGQTATRIRRRVEQFAWDAAGLPEGVRITVSAGVVVGEVGEAGESLIRRADQHLYQAKALGRNRVYPNDA